MRFNILSQWTEDIGYCACTLSQCRYALSQQQGGWRTKKSPPGWWAREKMERDVLRSIRCCVLPLQQRSEF